MAIPCLSPERVQGPLNGHDADLVLSRCRIARSVHFSLLRLACCPSPRMYTGQPYRYKCCFKLGRTSLPVNSSIGDSPLRIGAAWSHCDGKSECIWHQIRRDDIWPSMSGMHQHSASLVLKIANATFCDAILKMSIGATVAS